MGDPMSVVHEIIMERIAEHLQRIHDALEKMVEEWLVTPGLPGILVTHYRPKSSPEFLAMEARRMEFDLEVVTIEWSETVPPQHVYHYYSEERR